MVGEQHRKEARRALKKEYHGQAAKLKKLDNHEPLHHLGEIFNEVIEDVTGYFSGVEHYLPFFFKNIVTIIDYLPAESPVFLSEPARVREIIDTAQRERADICTDLLEQGGCCHPSAGLTPPGNTLTRLWPTGG